MIVKSKFTSARGNSEWMWVEIVKWQGERITGILQNQPNAIAAFFTCGPLLHKETHSKTKHQSRQFAVSAMTVC